MNPHTGDLVSDAQLEALRARDPEEAAKYSVRLEGIREDVEKIAAAVKATRKPHPLSMRAAAERAAVNTEEDPA